MSPLKDLLEADLINEREYEFFQRLWNSSIDQKYRFSFQNYSSFRQDYIHSQILRSRLGNSELLASFSDEERTELRSISSSTIIQPREYNQQWFKKIHYMRALQGEIIYRLNIFVDFSMNPVGVNVKNLEDLNLMHQLQWGDILPLSGCDTWLLVQVIHKIRSSRRGLMLPLCVTYLFTNDSSHNKTMHSESHCGLLRFEFNEEEESIIAKYQDTAFSADIRERFESSRLVGRGGRTGYREVKKEDYDGIEEGEPFEDRSKDVRVRVYVFLVQLLEDHSIVLTHDDRVDLQPWKLECCSLANLLNMLIGRYDNSFMRDVIECFRNHPSFRSQKPPNKECDDRSCHLTLILLFESFLKTEFPDLFLKIDPYCEVAHADINDDIGYTVCMVCDQSDHENTDKTTIDATDSTNLLMVCDCMEPKCNYAQHNGPFCQAGFVGNLANDKWYCPEHRGPTEDNRKRKQPDEDSC
jgi:hypothetical protein